MEKIDETKNTHESEQFKDLAVYTSTLYKEDPVSKVRAPLAIKFLENARDLGIRCVVTDSGSNQEFLDKLSGMENVTVVDDSEKKASMGESRRSALDKAEHLDGTEFFLYADPEKDDLITKENINEMLEMLRNDEADIVVPQRKSLESYPPFQAWVEKRANKRATELAEGYSESNQDSKPLDLWFGPKMMNRKGAKFFENYNDAKDKLDKWDSIIVPVIEAHNAGLRIGTVEVDYDVDTTQRDSEVNDPTVAKPMLKKRVEQYIKILEAAGDQFWIKKIKEEEKKKI